MGLSYRVAPAFSNSGSTGETSWAVTKQAGTASGDWIFMYVFAGTAAMACTGFTALPDSSGFGGLLYRRADGSEGATFTVTGLAGNRVSAAIVTVVGGASSLDVVGTFTSGGPASGITVPGVTLANSGDWVLWFAANQNGYSGAGFAITQPAGFASQGTNGALASNATIMVADDETNTAGPTGNQAGTFTSSSYFSGVMVGITPAASSFTAGLATAAGSANLPLFSPAQILASAAGAALQPTISTATAQFPGTGSTALGVKVELLLNSVWTDITTKVRLRNPVTITGGRADWTSTLNAASCTLTLDNRDGRFTPKNTAGAYFPFVTRNTQIRVSVNTRSSTGVTYSGYRFWGEVSTWPPTWDVSGHDSFTDITANGIWRRMSQLLTTLGSAFTRYNALTLTGLAQPRSYWPMEDGTGSGQIVPFDSVAGTANAVQSFITGAAGLSFASNTDFKGSDGIPQLNAAVVTATVPSGGTPTNNCTRFLLSVPLNGDSAQGTTAGNIIEIDSAGTAAKFEVYLNPSGTLLAQLVNGSSAVIAAGTTTTNVRGKPVLVSCELTPAGSNMNFAFRIITQGATGITESLTATVAGTIGQISTVKFSRAGVFADTAVGHLSVTYGTVPSMVAAAYALGGYVGEFAMTRFTRICAEMGITTETIGTAATTAAMGPQVDDTLENVIQSIEDVDMGLLYESKIQFGLGYRSLTSMANQAPAVVLNYPAGILDPSLSPVFDDALTRNNVTITNWTGFVQQTILTSGAMSVLSPPNGIGNGYGYTRTVNAALDTQVPGIANWLVNVGAVDEIRFPLISVQMANPAAAGFFNSLPAMRAGDYIQVTSMPSFLTASTVKQLVFGYTEQLNVNSWLIGYNTVPESPYETGFSAGTAQTAQLPGSGAVTSTAPGAGGLGGIVAAGSITPSMLSEGITVNTLGGNRITISVSAPANPSTGDIWIASATGLISSWSGTAWTPFKFDASQTIQAATIVASNIAASTITSGLIAAGTVVAGIVDTTNVFANLYVATSGGGEFLAYDTAAPASGHLINAIAGATGTDSTGNAYPKGFYGQQLTLKSQGSAPASFTGSSVLYTSTSGRLRYVSEIGADMILDRSVLDTTNVTMNTQTLPTIISRPFAYLANEASVGSEYEIEIDGTLTTPTFVAVAYQWDLLVDGSALSVSTTQGAGSVMIQTPTKTYNWNICYRLTVDATGAGGTCTVAMNGDISLRGANVGNVAAGSPQATGMANIDTSLAFDTTSAHTLAIYGHWGSTTGTGHSAISYRTKLTRRN